jgi:isoleucyl-tRNA synthetase
MLAHFVLNTAVHVILPCSMRVCRALFSKNSKRIAHSTTQASRKFEVFEPGNKHTSPFDSAAYANIFMSAERPLFKELPEKLDFPRMEEGVLQYWKEIDAFQTSLKKSEGRKVYTFYDGPPFATGLPHYGHILAGTIKDVVCRYAHQTGHYVERRFGWDCHGLPVEFEIEKALGIKSSHDVKAMGIAKYNAECRKIVMRFAEEWETIVGRTGRWIDFKNDYKTLNLPFMESVWWVFKQLFEKGLVYRGYKVMPYSTGCTTPLSNFECNMNYKEVSDPSATVSFPVVGDENTHLLAWTTTPWTLPSNLALVVHPDMDYVKAKDAKTGRVYIFLEARLGEIYKNWEKAKEKPFEIVGKVKGKDLVGLRYVPLFKYFLDRAAPEGSNTGAFRVVADTYVTSDSGTGIVHSAPGFGEEDFRVSLAHGVILKTNTLCPVDENGCFTDEVTDYKGRYVKECDNDILEQLKKDGRLFQKAAIVHSYPFCWRSETPLIYRAIDAWFVNVESFRDKLIENNNKTYWVPDYVKSKRFSNWLEDAKDWNVSRNRYWGTPLPVWRSDDFEEIVCIGSVEELERLSGRTGITDIHREFVDDITIPSKRPGMPPLRRVEQVFDCWFESGSMPYAQMHYPFENKEKFEQGFPADFIAEGLDQTRGWFYTLMVLSTALFDKPPFKNLVVNGLVLAEDGKKMSKSKKNYPPVTDILDKFGADATRLFLINSPVVRAEPLRFRESGVKDIITDIFLPLSNALKFFIMNGNRYMIQYGHPLDLNSGTSNDMDRWIRAATQTLVKYTRAEMEAYRLYNVVPGLLRFLEVLTNWYVRMNRRRLKGSDTKEEWEMSLNTLFQVLVATSRVMAPVTPFFAETMHQCLKPLLPAEEQEDSVHYLMIPEVNVALFDDTLERAMSRMITLIELVRVLRDRVKMPIKMPVRQIVVIHPQAEFLNDLKPLTDYIRDEVNAFEVVFTQEEGDYVITKLEANLAVLGKKYKQEAKALDAAFKALSLDEIHKFLSSGKITLLGKELTTEDAKVVRNFREGISNFETNTDGQVLVLLDCQRDETVIASWHAREFVKRIQMLRKTAGLQITDAVDVYFQADPALQASIESRADQVNATIRSKWSAGDAPADATVVAKEESDIADMKITLVFTKPAAN